MSVCVPSSSAISIPAVAGFCTANVIASGTATGTGVSSGNIVLATASTDGFYTMFAQGASGGGGTIQFTVGGIAIDILGSAGGGVQMQYFNLLAGQTFEYSSTIVDDEYSFPYAIYQF